MTCFVSLTFSIPLCSLQNPFKGKYAKESAPCRLPGLKRTKTASYSLAPFISNKCIFSFNGEHEHHWNIPTKHFEDIDSCSLNVSSCTQMTIIGYWVGPDIDDGWGFVESCIYQSS